MTQPSRVDEGSCPVQVIGTLQRHALTASVDAAVMEITAPRGVRFDVAEVGTLTGANAASLGQAVRWRAATRRVGLSARGRGWGLRPAHG